MNVTDMCFVFFSKTHKHERALWFFSVLDWAKCLWSSTREDWGKWGSSGAAAKVITLQHFHFLKAE